MMAGLTSVLQRGMTASNNNGLFFHLCGIRGYLHFKSTQCGYLIRFQTDSRCSCSWRRISPNSGHQYSCRAEESARRRAGGGSVPAALPLWERLRLRMAHRSSDGWSISIPHIWIYIGRRSLSDTEHLWTFFFLSLRNSSLLNSLREVRRTGRAGTSRCVRSGAALLFKHAERH